MDSNTYTPSNTCTRIRIRARIRIRRVRIQIRVLLRKCVSYRIVSFRAVGHIRLYAFGIRARIRVYVYVFFVVGATFISARSSTPRTKSSPSHRTQVPLAGYRCGGRAGGWPPPDCPNPRVNRQRRSNGLSSFQVVPLYLRNPNSDRSGRPTEPSSPGFYDHGFFTPRPQLGLC